ncbi:hypothetical protein AA0242T_1361 [Acetobacter aceti NRIC 0242]|uniref:Uncharacterized protein n=1 Tax=Acetobacter aceti NBRC 14818 TaxID=887700 RepID=A0AB33IKK2_ACEAC|nr:hypothetical protein [Acetobacter aceti]TCS31772.1 hypothetical protein EDC15_1154 [Acetobacter aceti NBRC 14818]BCK77191.1 hypothetical protein EMQ_2797 [Acetobacter aceti NBRC 14818]GAN58873.1 hypothetical protein Abac_088_004 [Acetobacter aceti NBRC 14818]GBO80659.1 hypothetical protein AA0242T_1361 [Acetobacter aceti NRIC 0242]
MEKDDGFTPNEALNKAINTLASAYDALEQTESVKQPIIDAVNDSLDATTNEYCASQIMILYLEKYTGRLLGQAAKRLPSKDLAQSHVDALLDEEQSRIFLLMRQLFPDQDNPDLDRLLKSSCDRLRFAAYDEIAR